MFPLGTALLPGEPLPLRIFEPRYRQMLADTLAGPTPAGFGVVLIQRGHEVGGGETRTDIGTFAEIGPHSTAADGSSLLSVTGTHRFAVSQWLPDDPYPRAHIRALPEPADDPQATESLVRTGERIQALIEVAATRRQAADASTPRPALPGFDTDDLAAVGVFGWAVRLPIGPADRQALLAADTAAQRAAAFADAIDTLEARVHFGS